MEPSRHGGPVQRQVLRGEGKKGVVSCAKLIKMQCLHQEKIRTDRSQSMAFSSYLRKDCTVAQLRPD